MLKISPNSAPFLWLGVVASIIGILGGLAQIGLAPFLDPLKTPIEFPLWLLVVPAIAVWAGVIILLGRATKTLHDGLERAQSQQRAAEADVTRLTNELASATARVASSSPDNRCAERLASYEALEREIVGLLKSGDTMTLSQIISGTSVSLEIDRQQRVTRAIAALGDQIEGNQGGYRLYKPPPAWA